MYDLKATQMNMQCRLIQELMLYEFELGYNTVEANKNLCKGEGTVDHNTVQVQEISLRLQEPKQLGKVR